MIPATITLKGIWAAMIALAFAVLLVLLGVQTVRIEGFKVWPISVEGWKPEAERLQHDLDNVKAAQGIALQKAQAAKAATEKKYADLAETTDANEQKARAQAMGDAERYIAAHRVRNQAAGGSAGRTAASAEDHGTASGDGAGSAPELDEVAVSADDIRICTVNTSRLEAVRTWAVDLTKP
jgi:hypothetical protein